jgi:hypothetical protein
VPFSVNVSASWQQGRHECEGGPWPRDNDLAGGLLLCERPPNQGFVLSCATALDQVMDGCLYQATSCLDALTLHEWSDRAPDGCARNRKTSARGLPPTLQIIGAGTRRAD